MAANINSVRRFVFKESKIQVNVDHASEEILVVSYPYNKRLYQGVLIDSTNRFLPCGYPSPDVVKWSPPRVTDLKDGVASADTPVSQNLDRPFYSLSNRFTYFQDVLFQKNAALVKSAKQAKAKVQKMTVRLRPRQVLCSKCRSICNENSENVHSSGKRDAKPEGRNLLTVCGDNGNRNLDNKSPRKKLRTTLVPKLSRLDPEELALNGARSEAGRVWSDMLEADRQMVLRKKRSVGSMEDLWDETVFEEASKKAKTTPIIKISFGSPGEGTVLKIPSKVRISGSEGEEDEEEEEKESPEPSKSIKKALKKAKKGSKRKLSPEREEEPSPEEPNFKKHKHRVKHKKKHKNSKEDDIKDKCLKQKLSISLRRVCGPGEEESWSGESSRSSELKNIEEERSEVVDTLLPLAARVVETQNHAALQAVNLPKRNKRLPGQRSKKLEKLESMYEKIPRDIHSGRIGSIIFDSKVTVDSSSPQSDNSLMLNASDDPAKTSLSTIIEPDKSNNIVSEIDPVCTSNVLLNSVSSPITKEVSLEANVQDLVKVDEIADSSVHPLSTDIDDQKMENTLLFSETDDKHNAKTDEDVSFKTDDVLDDDQLSEVSMPELDESAEDALLDGDMPEGFENHRDAASLKESSVEREIPVLTRMVDLDNSEHVKVQTSDMSNVNCKKITDFLGPKKKPSVSKDNLVQTTLDNFLASATENSLSREVNVSASEDPVDSSGESEFLPAEDSLDCLIPEEVPSTLSSSRNAPSSVLSDCSDSEVINKSLTDKSTKVNSKSISSKECSDQNESATAVSFLESNLGFPQNNESITSEASKNLSNPSDGSVGVRQRDRSGCDDKVHCSSSNAQNKFSLDSPVSCSFAIQSETDRPSPLSSSCDIQEIESNDSFLSKTTYFGGEVADRPPCNVKEDLTKESVVFTSATPYPSSDCSLGDIPCHLQQCPSERMESESVSSSQTEDLLDSIPNFPESVSQGAPQEVTSCQTEDGSVLTVGDIVWAKIHGFPWWPAKVVRLCVNGNGSSGCDARVAWFGSATSSLMSTDRLSPFIQTFKAKYNKERKSTGYLEAIKQATSEAFYHLPQPLAELDKLFAL